MRPRIAVVAATAVLAVGAAAVVTVATANASEDTGVAVTASSGTGQPVSPGPTESEPSRSTRAPEPDVSTTPPAAPTGTTGPGPTRSPVPSASKTSSPEPGRQTKTPTHPPTQKQYSGRATSYQPGMGTCGYVFGADDLVAAIDPSLYGQGYPGPHCGEEIVVTYKGKSITVKVLDRAPGAGRGDLDLTPAAFKALASSHEGKINVTWHFAKQ
ncbi:RlpA-like double-psi beta-barrel domain-containing protein [Streptomyces sp. NPDC059917]|uniref:RlpA-like double-psi beta-barrel domain-containing protein n=1 Tax=Streptomyces sp. NPDC059917 TaxID=3347002 RepID=UPI0036697B72